ncbi:hypothetical protein BRAS3809_2390019 [Bradyrhizobium sp. STM 3809]|nr:hypothetical protein BRAS3809_2390019 [Bradyrhizobium sp. STM 3809]
MSSPAAKSLPAGLNLWPAAQTHEYWGFQGPVFEGGATRRRYSVALALLSFGRPRRARRPRPRRAMSRSWTA